MKCKGAKCPYFVAYDDGEFHIDHKIISVWHFNGEFHIEINHEKVV